MQVAIYSIPKRHAANYVNNIDRKDKDKDELDNFNLLIFSLRHMLASHSQERGARNSQQRKTISKGGPTQRSCVRYISSRNKCALFLALRLRSTPFSVLINLIWVIDRHLISLGAGSGRDACQCLHGLAPPLRLAQPISMWRDPTNQIRMAL